MTKPVAYAWEENDKFFLSKFPYAPNNRQAANWYDSKTELLTEAGRRRLQVEWVKSDA